METNDNTTAKNGKLSRFPLIEKKGKLSVKAEEKAGELRKAVVNAINSLDLRLIDGALCKGDQPLNVRGFTFKFHADRPKFSLTAGPAEVVEETINVLGAWERVPVNAEKRIFNLIFGVTSIGPMLWVKTEDVPPTEQKTTGSKQV
jgi:hypothetical protein